MNDEEIFTVFMYECPLSGWQLTKLIFFHQFVVFKTTNWYWSVGKNSEEIVIQRSKKNSTV